MSAKKVDERVVEMRFDNANFESNVKTSLSTLDKLKNALKFSGATKGLTEVNNAAKKVDFSGMQNGIETVNARFTSLQVIATTALANITTAAMNAGRNLISSFTIQPITNGFREYELQMNSVQTILANTASKGTDINDVTAALDELNTYADQTIYNFAEMTRNIGTFTAAGVDLDKATQAIKGIANLGAMSGSSSVQVSTAMYQLSQALATGRVTLMDWNSVVNAGMGGEQFQNALKRTAEHFGTDVDALIEQYGSFRESLTNGEWLTADVLTETLNQIAGAYSEADLISQGYTEDQARAITEMAQTATDAATKVKTFTQLMDTLSEAAGSGWAKSFQLIMGDFEETKEFFTDISEYLGDIIGGMSDSRNAVLEGAFSSSWQQLSNIVRNAGYDVDTFEGKVRDLASSNGADVDALVKQYGSLDKAIQNGAISSDIIGEALNGAASESEELSKKLSENNDEIENLINTMNRKSGRQLFLESIKNVLEAILEPLKAIGRAFNEVFGVNPESLYQGLAALNSFTSNLVAEEDTLNNITGIFKGLFGIVKIFTSLLGGAFSVAFHILNGILGEFDLNILDVLGAIGEAIYAFSDWITSGNLFLDIVNAIGSALSWLLSPLSGFVNELSQIPQVQSALTAISGAFDRIKGFFESFINTVKTDGPFAAIQQLGEGIRSTFSNLSWDDVLTGLSNFGTNVRNTFFGLVEQAQTIGPDIIQGLANGLGDGVNTVITKIQEIANRIIEAAKAVLGIQSPSTEFFTIGQNVIEGFINGIKAAWEGISGFFSGLISGIVDIFGEVDWGQMLTVGILGGFGVGTLAVANKFADTLSVLTKPIEGVGNVLNSFAGLLGSVSKYINAKVMEIKTESILNVAKAIALLAASIAVLALIGPEKIIPAVVAIGVLAGVLVGMVAIINKMAGESPIEMAKLSGMMLSLGAAMILISASVAIISGISIEGIAKAMAVLAAFTLAIGYLSAAASTLGKSEADLKSFSKLVRKMATSLLVLSIAIGVMSLIPWEGIGKAAVGLAGFTAFVLTMSSIAKVGGKSINKAGSVIRNVSSSLLILSVALAVMTTIPWDGMAKAAVGMLGLVGIVALMAMITRTKGMNEVPKSLTMMAASMLILAVVVRMIAGMEWQDLAKGVAGVAVLGLVVSGLVAATRKAGNGEMAKVSVMLLSMSIAVGILAGVAILLSLIEPANLIKGIAAVSALSGLVVAMTLATKNAKDVKGTMIGIATAIGVMAASLAILSFIDGDKLATATAALGVVMGMFALIVKNASNIKSSIPTLIIMMSSIALLTGALYLLSGLPIETTLASSAALSALLLSMAVSMRILGSMGKASGTAIASIITMTAIIAALSGIMILLSQFDISVSMETVSGLTTLLLALSTATFILSAAGNVSPTALAATVVLTAVVAALAVILGILSALNIAPSLETALALSTLLIAMSAAVGILGLIGGIAPAAIAGAVSLVAVAGIITAAIAAFGAISQIPGAQWLVEEGGNFLQSIGTAIGQFVGGIAGGFLEGATSGLPETATSLSTFMTNLQPFLDGAASIDSSIVDSITSLATAVALLVGADFLQSITSFITGGNSLEEFGNQLAPFGKAMAEFGREVEGIDPEAVSAAAKAAEGLAALANALPKEGGIAQAIFGTSDDLTSFSEQMKSFGTALVEFSTAVSSNGGLNLEAINNAVTAGQSLNELAQALPKEGGLAQAIFGTTEDLGSFGDQLKSFGTGLSDLSASSEGISLENIQKAVDAGYKLDELQDALPEGVGWVEEMFGGEGTLTSFGKNLTSYGTALKQFGESIVGVDFEKMNSITNASRNVVNFIESATDADMGGIDNIKKIKDVGTAVKNYYGEISSVDTSTVESSVNSIERLIDSINEMASLDTSGIATFQSAINQLAQVNVSAVVEAFAAASGQMVVSGMNLVMSLAEGMELGSLQVRTVARTIAETLRETIAGYASHFNEEGLGLITELGRGMERGSSTAARSVRSVLTSSVNTIRSYRNSFYNAGYYVAQGFASGISNGSFAARTAARAMANAAKVAAEQALDENSPSKVFYGIGSYAGEGFVNGLISYNDISYKSGYGMAKQASDGLKKAMSSVSLLSSDDLEIKPVVTPVVDMSNVESASRLLNSSIGGIVPVSLLSEIGSINRAMNRRNQNGVMDDVVKAVDRVGTKIDGMSKPSYSIAGITYDDGTAIADAVNNLIRAVVLEGRV